MRADAVSVVESAYAIDLPEDEWVGRICEASWAAFGIGIGCIAYVYDASGATLEMSNPRSTEGAASHTPERVRGICGELPKELLARLHTPSPPTALLNEMILGPVLDYPMPRYNPALRQESISDYVGVRGGGLDRRGVLLSFPVTPAFRGLAAHTRRTLDRVAAHLAAGYRLRSAAPAPVAAESASAVLTPNGRVEHLGDDGEIRQERGALVDAVRRMEHARGALGRMDPEQGLAEWQALVRGRWSVLDFVDRDGKRFILARRNEPLGRDLLAITDVERQVLELASLGHPNKLIAYELGLAQSTVTAHLKRGLRKLGVGSRQALVAHRVLGASSKH